MMEVLQKIISKKFTVEVLCEIVKKQTGWINAFPRNIALGGHTKKGDAYMSVVTRFTVEVSQGDGEGAELHQVHMIAKGLPANIARRNTFRSLDFFRNEIAFYTKAWPAVEEFQRSKTLTNPFNAVPKCLASYCDGFHDFIVLEDLSHDGFSSMPRTTGLNFDDAVKILKLFGKFHALSLAFGTQQPDDFETAANSLEETYFDEKFRDWYCPVLAKMCWILRDAVEKELPVEYLDRLDHLLKEDIYGEAVKQCKDRSQLCVINQGDCWPPNLLTKFKNGHTETKIIDYQVARCASATTDLSFFLYVCVAPETRDSCWEDLLKEYHCSFAYALEEYGSDETLISIDLIKENMRKVRHFTFAMALETIVVSGIDDEDVVDLDSIQEETTMDKVWILRLIQNSDHRSKLAGFFKHMFDTQFA